MQSATEADQGGRLIPNARFTFAQSSALLAGLWAKVG
jgi:hypothetical protein